MSASHRSYIRQAAVQAAFERLFRGTTEPLSVSFLRGMQLFEAVSYDTEFAEKLLKEINERADDIRSHILAAAPAYPWEHIHLLDRAILTCRIAELLYVPDAPAKIIINEYVEIAKNYGGEGTRKFVNGVLGAVFTSTMKSV